MAIRTESVGRADMEVGARRDGCDGVRGEGLQESYYPVG